MSHDLSIRETGEVEYAYAGQKPWHGLGQAVAGAMTAEEAIRMANLGWTVSKRELITVDGIAVPENFAIVRDDTNTALGVVGPQYIPTQINEALAFCDAVTGLAGAKYISVGALGGGKRIFIVAQLNGIIRIKGDDTVERFLTFCHSHDGTMAHRLFLPTIRVVCANTLNMALNSSEAREGFYARHTGNLEYKVDQAASILGFMNKRFELFEEQAKALAEVVCSVQQVEKFIRSTFEIEKPEEVSDQKKSAINSVLDNFENGEKNKLAGIAGTAWALLNATTEFADHSAPAVITDDTERRFNSIMFGGGADLKRRAFNAALEMVNV